MLKIVRTVGYWLYGIIWCGKMHLAVVKFGKDKFNITVMVHLALG